MSIKSIFYVKPGRTDHVPQFLTTIDVSISHMPVHTVLFYDRALEIGALIAAIQKALDEQPDYAGMLVPTRRGIRIDQLPEGLPVEVRSFAHGADNYRRDDLENAGEILADDCSVADVIAKREPVCKIVTNLFSDGSCALAIRTVHSFTDGNGLSIFLQNISRAYRGATMIKTLNQRENIETRLFDGIEIVKENRFLVRRNLASLTWEFAKKYLFGGVKSGLGQRSKPLPHSCFVEIACNDLARLKQGYGLMLGHVINAMILQALSKTQYGSQRNNLVYLPVLNVRENLYPGNYTGNALIAGVFDISTADIAALPVRKLSSQLFARHMKATKKSALQDYVGSMRTFDSQLLFNAIRGELSVMIDNISQLNFSSVDFGDGAPACWHTPPPSDITIPFIYILPSISGGYSVRLTAPMGLLDDFPQHFKALVSSEVERVQVEWADKKKPCAKVKAAQALEKAVN